MRPRKRFATSEASEPEYVDWTSLNCFSAAAERSASVLYFALGICCFGVINGESIVSMAPARAVWAFRSRSAR